jgi:signal peptidase I
MAGQGQAGQGQAPPRRRPWRITYWVTFGLLCVAVVGLAVGFLMTFRDARVLSSSMAPTIQPGDLVGYQRGATGIARGDVVLLQYPGVGLVVKRVIGLPGDRVTCCDSAGRVAVDGKALAEDYLPPGAAPSQAKFAVTLPPSRVWVLGDNRLDSLDSRIWGPLPMSDIVGRVITVSRPGSRTLLRTPATFTAGGLAPADHRIPLPFLLVGLALAAILAVIVQAAAGITVRVMRRRRRRLRQQPQQMAGWS